MSKTRNGSVIFALICGSVLVHASPATALNIPYNTGAEHVSGTLFTPQYTDQGQTYGPFQLGFSYARSFDGAALTKHAEINFVFAASLCFNDAQKSAFRVAVETNIERIWNNRFAITDTANNNTFLLTVDLETDGPTFHQTVAVHPGSGRADALNWFQDIPASIMAHEFGHMLGLFDEYIGGAVDKYPNPTLSDEGLMGLGALSTDPKMLPRYYQQYVDYMAALNPGHHFVLNAVPEPSALLLFATSVFGLLVRRALGSGHTFARSPSDRPFGCCLIRGLEPLERGRRHPGTPGRFASGVIACARARSCARAATVSALPAPDSARTGGQAPRSSP